MRRVSLIVMPEDGRAVRQYRVPVWPLAAILGALGLGLLLICGAVLALVRSERLDDANGRLFAENETLRSELLALGGRIDGLDATVRAHIRLANDARLLAGLPPYGEEVALLGVGGLHGTASTSQSGVGRTIHFYEDRIDQLARRLDFQQESLVEVRDLIEENRERLDHVPTINPVLGRHFFSSGFGPRRDPFTGRKAMHNGLDICAERGTPFCATADGTVVFAGRNGNLGNTVKIDHGNGFLTVYGHAHALAVRQGQSVLRGDRLGTVGQSGRATGVHLHYEVRKESHPTNPWPYILDRKG
ncbi:MAG: peptidoglycan DD-metalloendopeptidase family protein [Candidatus Eisenbacteria bacterium]|nr:peptidoglycan DD-metalloendopeptidase family protein [Candidatus Eisenbacteria bacterium]